MTRTAGTSFNWSTGATRIPAAGRCPPAALGSQARARRRQGRADQPTQPVGDQFLSGVTGHRAGRAREQPNSTNSTGTARAAGPGCPEAAHDSATVEMPRHESARSERNCHAGEHRRQQRGKSQKPLSPFHRSHALRPPAFRLSTRWPRTRRGLTQASNSEIAAPSPAHKGNSGCGFRFARPRRATSSTCIISRGARLKKLALRSGSSVNTAATANSLLPS